MVIKGQVPILMMLTVLVQLDAAATVKFIFMSSLCVATVWEQRLVESSVCLLQPRRPLPCFNFCTRHAHEGAIDSILGAASTQEWRLFLPAVLVVRPQFNSGVWLSKYGICYPFRSHDEHILLRLVLSKLYTCTWSPCDMGYISCLSR